MSQVEHYEDTVHASSHSTSADLSLPQPFFRKELQDLDEKFVHQNGQIGTFTYLRSQTFTKAIFFTSQGTGRTSATNRCPLPDSISSISCSGQASSASGPEGVQTTKSLDMSSPLENLYLENDLELVFAQPGLVFANVSYAGLLTISAREVIPPEQYEEGEVSDPEDQPDLDTGDPDHAINKNQNYIETVWGVRAFMGWMYILDLNTPQHPELIIRG